PRKMPVPKVCGYRLGAILVALMLTISGGVYLMLERAVDAAITEDATAEAAKWVSFFEKRLPDVEGLLETRRTTEAQREVIRSAIDFGGIFRFKLFDPDGRLVVASDAPEGELEGMLTPNATAAKVYQDGLPYVSIEDGRNNPARPDVYAEAYVAALGAAGNRIGVLEVYVDKTKTSARLTASFRWIALGLPALCALIYLLPSIGFLWMTQAKRVRDAALDRLSRFDPLTGLFNRGTFTNKAEDLFYQRRETEEAIGVLSIDIDNFKSVNDTFGHELGDRFLWHVADLLAEALPAGAFAGRMGGDEMVAIVPGLTQAQLRALSERLVEEVRTPFESRGVSLTAHISIGTYFSSNLDTMEEALHASDL
ncbi:MAG: diguanylate cyclase, partial [Pseudomonadota bacterium]